MKTFVPEVAISSGSNSGGGAISSIAKGDLLFLDEDGNVISTAAGAAALSKFSRVKIAVGLDTGKAQITTIRGDMVASYTGQDYQAEQTQITYVGYNPNTSAGSLPVEDLTEYQFGLVLKGVQHVNGMRQPRFDYHIRTDSNATQLESAQKIIDLVEKDRAAKDIFEVIRVSSEDSFSVFTADPTVTNGSPTVTFASAVTIAAGTAIKIREASYVVEEGVSSGTTIKLDQPYKGSTETIDVSVETTVAGTISPTDWGFKVESKTVDFDEYNPYRIFSFVANYAKVGGTKYDVAEVATTQASDKGTGTYKEVFEKEEKALAYSGWQNNVAFPVRKPEKMVSSSGTYDNVTITYFVPTDSRLSDTTQQRMLTLFLPNGSDHATNSADNFLDILNGFFSDVVGFAEVSFS